MKCCVIGLGSFGFQVAITLADNGMEVLAIDSDDIVVNRIRDRVSQAICLNISGEEALRSVGIEEMDVLIIGMGENVAQSILITALAKQHFSIPRVITRSVDSLHKEVLILVGADQVILPEQEIATRLADMLSLPFNALMRLTPTFSLSYRKAPRSLIGKPLKSCYELYQVVCIGKKKKESIEALSPDYVIAEHDILVYAGSNEDLSGFSKG